MKGHGDNVKPCDETVQCRLAEDWDSSAGFEEEEVLSFVSDGDGTRLDAWLAKRCAPELSRSRIQTLMDEGRVRIDGTPATSKTKPQAGQTVTVAIPPPEPAEPQPEDIPINIVYEDSDIILINKQADLVVHPAPGHSSGTLVNALLFHCSDLRGIGGTARPGIVHRLDKDTTGLIVVAKHEQALNNLAAQFQNGETAKVYLALVHGSPDKESGTVKTTIGRHPTDRKRMAVNPPHGKNAVSHWTVEKRFGNATLLRVKIDTGRTHQIRVHMAHIGLPIVGDQVYGNPGLDRKITDCPKRQMLHATSFSFNHPADGRRMEFNAPPPPDMEKLISRLM